jgi:hypothetical protein
MIAQKTRLLPSQGGPFPIIEVDRSGLTETEALVGLSFGGWSGLWVGIR